MVPVPKVRRLAPAKARRALEDVGFKVEVRKITNEEFMFDRVLRQEPKGDELAKKGSTVIITVNSGDAE